MIVSELFVEQRKLNSGVDQEITSTGQKICKGNVWVESVVSSQVSVQTCSKLFLVFYHIFTEQSDSSDGGRNKHYTSDMKFSNEFSYFIITESLFPSNAIQR